MDMLILYFSGTGNTRFIADEIARNLTGRGHAVTLSPMERFDPGEAGSWDVLLFGYPIYACDMPSFVKDYAERLAIPKTRAVVFFATMALYAGNAAPKAMKRFMDRGMIPLHFETVRLPGSDGLAFMGKHSRYVKKICAADYASSSAITGAVDRIASAAENALDHKLAVFHRVRFPGLLADGLMGMSYGFIEAFIRKRFRADENCTRCGRCQRMCPVGNITVEPDKVAFGDHCILCMRCLHQCPAEAIQIGSMTRSRFRWKGPSGDYDPLK